MRMGRSFERPTNKNSISRPVKKSILCRYPIKMIFNEYVNYSPTRCFTAAVKHPLLLLAGILCFTPVKHPVSSVKQNCFTL